ncbi:MAG: hypothetical protein ACT4SY_05480 [Hyphomicrobiales bacterium]
MKRSFVFVLAAALTLGISIPDSDAAKKKQGWKNYNSEQRAKLMEEARKACRKKFGAISASVRIDYYREIIWCYPT